MTYLALLLVGTLGYIIIKNRQDLVKQYVPIRVKESVRLHRRKRY